jgi:glutathione S-transferase
VQSLLQRERIVAAQRPERGNRSTPQATLTISSKNYSSWSLRGWLLCRMAGLAFDERPVDLDDPESRQELLLLSPSVRVPRLSHDGVEVWDTLAIAEYLHEIAPEAGLLPEDRVARAHCRAVSGEIHSGFYNLRSALPMNLKARHKAFKVFSGARPDIERIREIWSECLSAYGGPWLFGAPSMADAMFAPVCTRFRTYAVELDPALMRYCETVFAWPLLQEWTEGALAEPEEIVELEVEF